MVWQSSVPDDPRIGEMIQSIEHKLDYENEQKFDTLETNKYDIVLLGFPTDEGVRRNGGRLGARNGPKELRSLMKRVGTIANPEFQIDVSQLKLGDFGDVPIQTDQNTSHDDLEKAHLYLEKAVFHILNQLHAIPFVVGGGNDQSYPNALGLLKTVKDYSQVGVINIDAHLDVRPMKEGKHHSGSPFRRLLETSGFVGSNFVEFAAQGTQCSAQHVQYIEDKKGSVLWLTKDLRAKGTTVIQQFLQVLDKLPSNVFVSFDIDSIISSDCPGVSAPATIGLTAQEALEIMYESGKSSKVKLVDLSEYNPVVENYRTGKLIANMFAYFCMGYKQRK